MLKVSVTCSMVKATENLSINQISVTGVARATKMQKINNKKNVTFTFY